MPEVVQSSAMDCGPATLKCLLEGFGVPVSYGRLREACQTDVDGTSIDTLEEIAGQLGLEAEQIMVPADFLLLDEAQALPAIVVVQQPNGSTHFVVVWRRHGPFLQIMDPALGRRWIQGRRFLEEAYRHTTTIPASDWREWAGSDQSLDTLRRRLKELQVPGEIATRLLETGLADSSWRTLAALDATVRMVAAIVRSGGLARGAKTARVLQSFFDQARRVGPGAKTPIPGAYWSAQPAPPSADGVEQVSLSGLVLVRVLGRRAVALHGAKSDETESGPIPKRDLSPELAAALTEPPSRPGRDLWRWLRADGLLTPTVLLAALGLAAVGVAIEALLFRGLFDLGRDLALTGQRLAAMLALSAFVAALLLLEWPATTGLMRLGLRLEARLRIAFLEKLPRLVDRYFQSRLVSDMAERGHTVHWIRMLPWLAGSFLRSAFELLLTTAGIIWLDPRSAPLALLAAAVSLGLPLLLNPVLTERDLRVRTHVGALSRFYLDALLGLVPLRAHGAERTLRSEHEGLLVEWSRSGLDLQRAVVVGEAVQAFAGFGLAAWLLIHHLGRGGEAGTVLLLVYWALNLPVLGQEIALLARQYPLQRNVTLRLLEPIGAPEECGGPEERGTRSAERGVGDIKAEIGNPISGTALAFSAVTVRAAGHTILESVDLQIPSGHHVAIVGPSGAGKSTLIGLLLGWHRPAEGQVRIDGAILDAARLDELRRETAWVDPTVQLWNRSLLANLQYGATEDAAPPVGWVIEQADLRQALAKLPDGLQSALGESGALLSGGEGQRVRFGRGLFRPGVRLVLLDEPFRGLDRESRRNLLARARAAWTGSTLICVTHDVSETHSFDRVLVIEGGRIVEDDSPAALAARPGSRYRALLEAEIAVREGLWSSRVWRRLRLEEGRVVETKGGAT